MSNNSVSIYSFPANARAVTTPAPQTPAAPAIGANTVTTSPAGSEASRASGVAAEGASAGHQLAAQGQDSHFKTARANAYVNAPPASGARTMDGRIQLLELGSKGPDVYALQLQLIRLGYLTPEQVAAGVGIFSNKTCAAVRSFQEQHGLEPNGVVGRETREAIILARVETPSATTPAARGSHHPSAPAAPTKPAAPAKPAAPSPKPSLPGAATPKSKPVDAPETSAVGNRKRETYKKVIDQFDVSKNKRYEQGKNGQGHVTSKYCNIFVWDVTRAMGAEIPHWVDTKGNPTSFGVGYELDANGTVDWMNNHGTKHGWRKVDDKEAQRMANEGHPAAVLWKNPGGIGHVAMVRPGEITKKGPAISQAGSKNLNEAHVYDIFGANAKLEYWVHD